MATTKEIKNRIKSVKDTQKITNAMYLISSTKMTRAKKELDNTRPYFDMLKRQIITMIHMTEDVKSGFFKSSPGFFEDGPVEEPMAFDMAANVAAPDDEEEHAPDEIIAYLVITADKGLAGAYNQNVIKEAIRLIDGRKNYKLFVVGEYGRHYFEARGLDIEETFLHTAQNPSLERAREITSVLIDLYSKKKINKVYIVYTDFKNGLMGGDVISTEILPFDKRDFELDEASEKLLKENESMSYLPNVITVLNNIVPSYLMGYIYSALVDSFCSEQSARMSAMDAANNNAEELLTSLNLEYNHVRQSAITQEITEVSAGSRGQKKSKKKRMEREEGSN